MPNFSSLAGLEVTESLGVGGWFGVGFNWVLCLTQQRCFYSCFGLSWVELSYVGFWQLFVIVCGPQFVLKCFFYLEQNFGPNKFWAVMLTSINAWHVGFSAFIYFWQTLLSILDPHKTWVFSVKLHFKTYNTLECLAWKGFILSLEGSHPT